jgi:hypothetical protein
VWTRSFAPPPPFPVTVELRDASGRAPKRVSAGGKPLRYACERNAVVIPMTLAAIWRAVRVDWD